MKKAFFGGDGAGIAMGSILLPAGEELGDFFEGLVLEESGEEQIAGFQQFQVGGVDHVALWEQPCSFEVEKGRCYDQKFGDGIEAFFFAEAAGVRDELICHFVQCYLGDVEFAILDQLQEQIKRTFEVPEAQPETTITHRLALNSLNNFCSKLSVLLCTG